MGFQAGSPTSFEITVKATVCSTGGYIGSQEEKAAIMTAESLFILVSLETMVSLPYTFNDSLEIITSK